MATAFQNGNNSIKTKSNKTKSNNMKTPRTDIEAFDYRPSQFGGNSFRHTKYGILVEAEFARKLEKELNEANDRIQELEAYMALAKSGLRQLGEKMKGRV